jgi:transposase InsO family protein
MRASGIEGVRLCRRRRTIVLPIGGGKFCYPATVIDLASRRPAGWAIADHTRTDLVTDALAAAVRTRGSLAGAIMHTDHGAPRTRAGPSLKHAGQQWFGRA